MSGPSYRQLKQAAKSQGRSDHWVESRLLIVPGVTEFHWTFLETEHRRGRADSRLVAQGSFLRAEGDSLGSVWETALDEALRTLGLRG